MSGAPLRIVVVEPTASGGLAAHVRDEIAALADAGVPVIRADAEIGPRPAIGADLRALRRLRRILRAADPRTDALHAHGLRAGALAVLARCGLPHRPRIVVTLHNRPVGGRATRTIGRALARIVARGADLVLAVSPDLLDEQRALGAAEARLAVIPAAPAVPRAGGSMPRAAAPLPGTSGGAMAPERPDDPGTEVPVRFLAIARLAPQKGLTTLLDAVARIQVSAPGAVEVSIAGDGPLRDELAARIGRESLPVALLGRRDDVPDLLARADAVVSSAVWEGQPVSLQEALHAGRAIVATDAGGTSAVTGDAARLVPVGDAGALAAAMLAIRDPEERRRAEARSLRRAAELPGRDDLATQLLEVLAPPLTRW